MALPSLGATFDTPVASFELPDAWDPFDRTITRGTETVELFVRARG